MALWPVGTRVKKVRGQYTGYTGVVMSSHALSVDGHPLSLYQYLFPQDGYDCMIHYDQPGPATDGRMLPAGVWSAVHASWEPIIPEGAAPSQLSYEELLDSLTQQTQEIYV